MRILVCIRQGMDGEINPFDACAYEEALRIKNAEVVIMSMGPLSVRDFLLRLTRLGARKAILLSDKAFAGADTLATAYTLSLAAKRIKPDLIFCGRQALVGDTAQTGPMLSAFTETNLITNVLSIKDISQTVTAETRDSGVRTVPLPALLTIERINNLRLPSIMSKPGETAVWTADDLSADREKCGLSGSRTRVERTFENQSGKRVCKFISSSELLPAISDALRKNPEQAGPMNPFSPKLEKVFAAGDAPYSFAETISSDITVLPITNADDLTEKIKTLSPNAVLWGSDSFSKEISAQVAARLGLGLCADCTSLETDGKELFLYRPALAGSVIAKVQCLTKPAMATMRTERSSSDIVVSAGFGAKNSISIVRSFADRIGAELAATRKMVDNAVLPYNMQVGLTGKTISPRVYIAVGVSGAVQHIAGMQKSRTIIAINPDKNAPIFEYADFGIIDSAENALNPNGKFELNPCAHD